MKLTRFAASLLFLLPLAEASPDTVTAQTCNPSQHLNSLVNGVLSCSNDTGAATGRTVYASQVSTVGTGDAVVAAGSNTQGTDQAAIFQQVLTGGNVHFIIDGQYGLSTSLKLYSHTEVTILPGGGVIMQSGSGGTAFQNANQNAPTTTSGTGGYLPSNIQDAYIAINGGGIINSNATNSTTRSDHRGNGNTLYTGLMFLGVDHLTIDHIEVYDSPLYGMLISNTVNLYVGNNYIHNPTPLVLNKNTDGIHLNGPVQYFWITNNRLNTGDDAIALNADDCYRPGWGTYACGSNPNLPNAAAWGPIVDGYLVHNTLDNSEIGIRLLSATERIDRVSITDLSGTTVSRAIEIDPFFSSLGNGNFGDILISGVYVNMISGSPYCLPGGTPGTSNCSGLIVASGNINQLKLSNVLLDSPSSPYPLLWVFYGSGTIKQVALDGLMVNTPSGNVPIIVRTDQAINSMTASNIYWTDAITGTGTFFGGSVPPTEMSVSNTFVPSGRLVPTSGYGYMLGGH